MAIEFDRGSPWELPGGWVWARLGDLVDPRRAKAPPDRKSTLDFVGLDDVPPNGLRIERRRPFREMRSAGNAFRVGDILYGRLRPYLNKVVIGDTDGVASGEFVVMRPKPGIEARYVQLAMHSRRFVNDATRDTTGDRPRIDFERISEIRIPVAPSAEQRRIVARIDELFAEIADGETALSRARDDLDTWRRSLLKSAVTGELTSELRERNRPNETGADVVARLREAIADAIGATTRRRRKAATDDEAEIDQADLPELPRSWCWSRVGEIGKVSGGVTKNAKRAGLGCKLPFLRVANVQYGALDLTQIHEIDVAAAEIDRILLQKDDLLVVEGNGSIDQIGRCAIWTGEISPCVHQNHLIKIRFADSELAFWAFYWLMSPHGRQLVTKVASSTSGLHTLSISKIQAIPIPIPPTAEIKAILGFLATEGEAEDTVEDDLRESGKTVAPIRQSILKLAFEGGLVDQDPRDEPAENLLARTGDRVANTASAQRRRWPRAGMTGGARA